LTTPWSPSKSSITTKTKGNEGCVVLKLDISKVYDCMDWDHMREVMVKMGFNDKWIHWMSMCVESVDYLVLVNNDDVYPIISGRGLRQVDPLSPYLFMLCAKGLSSLICDVEERKIIIGTSICRGAPPISQLLFADYYFLFFKADEGQAQAMKNILVTYETTSSQAVSLPMSKIYCSHNVSGTLKISITNVLGMQVVLGNGKYLRLQSMVGRDRNSNFSYIKDIVWNRINFWSIKCLSQVGREVMIKSGLQDIPSYVMRIFQSPMSLITTIERMMNSFRWGHSGANNRGIHWLLWEKFSMHKVHGGMGFKGL